MSCLRTFGSPRESHTGGLPAGGSEASRLGTGPWCKAFRVRPQGGGPLILPPGPATWLPRSRLSQHKLEDLEMAERKREGSTNPLMPDATGAMNPGDDASPGTAGTGEDVCPECSGTGRIAAGECKNCGGSGKVIKGIAGG